MKMKKFPVLLLLSAAFLAFGCSKNEEPKPVDKAPVFNVTFAQEVGGIEYKWKETDALAACDGAGKSEKIGIDKKYAGGTQAEFASKSLDKGSYRIFFPGELFETASGTLTLPSTQQYTEGFGVNNISILTGSGSGTALELKHASSFIGLSFDEPIYGLILSSTGSESIAGKIEFNGAAIKSASGSSGITINGIPGAGISKAVIAIPPVNLSKGLDVKIIAEAGSAVWYQTNIFSSGFNAEAGKINNAPLIEVSKMHGDTENIITTAAQFKDFLASAASKASDELWVLGADIDLSGTTISPASDLKATFDGKGHSIKNWKIACPLFTTNSGTIKNIIIDGSCQLDPTIAITDNFGIIVGTNNGPVSGCTNNANLEWTGSRTSSTTHYFSAIVGYSNVSIDNCTNNGNITINLNSASGTVDYAGVAGRIGSSSITDCHNTGKITVNYTNVNAKNIYYGGVVAVCNSTCTIQGCSNSGDVSFNTPDGKAAVTLAGVAAYIGGGSIKECQNSGKVSYISNDGIKGSLVGGVCAYNAGDVSNCENTGDVTISGTAFRGRNFIGNVNGTITKSTATILEGGIAAIGSPASASSFKFNMHDCKNSGKISLLLSSMNSSPSLSGDGKICIGGLVGDASGPIFTSDNNGDVEVKLLCSADYTASNSGYTSYIGGIAGANYFSQVQSELSITNCNNTGNVYYKTENKQSTFNMVAGIVGFSGLSANSCSNLTMNCVNTGKISAEGTPQLEIGGIHGSPGRLENCRNEGEIVGNTSLNRIVIGGIAGFHTNAFQITDCTNTGNVSTTNDLSNSGIGALMGLVGNSENTSGEGCVLNCKISCPETTSKGMVIGLFNGTTNKITLGTELNPISVKGSVIIGGNETVLTAANYRSYVYGSGYTEGTHTINTTFGDPVKPEPEDKELNGTTILRTTTLYGLITDKSSGKGIAGVPVTDGYTYVETDANGVYQMVADYRCRCVSMSVPASYAIPMDSDHTPAFYSNDIEKGVISRRDFVLEGITPINDFTLAGIGDIHVGRNSGSSSSDWVATSTQRLRNVLLKDMCDHFAEEGETNAFAFTVGDESNSNNNNQWPSIVSSTKNIPMSGGRYLPLFHCMGNHDHMGNCGTTETDFFVNQRIRFIQNLGPADYSLNIGKAHIVVLDNAAYNGATAYRLYNDSWKWFLDDLSHVADKSDKLLILVMHCPLRDGKSIDGSPSFADHREDILNAAKAFHQVHILDGHTHRSQEWVHTVRTAGGYPILEHIHGMAGGTYWRYTNCPDGSPYGYNVYKVSGNEVIDYYMKPCGMSKDTQMRVYNGSQNIAVGTAKGFWYSKTNSFTASSGTSYNAQGAEYLKDAFVVSVWHGDDVNWSYELWKNGVKVGDLRKTPDICDVMNAAYTYNDGDGNGDQVCKDSQHFYYIAAPSGNPATETGWTVKAIHRVPSSKNITHTYECSTLTTSFEGFLWK